MVKTSDDPKDLREMVHVSVVPASRDSRMALASLSVEAAWLDRLLVSLSNLPVSSGESAVVEAVVQALSDIFPDHGVGACFVAASPPESSPMPQLQRHFKYVPDGEEARAEGMDPTRLFPGYRHERVFDVTVRPRSAGPDSRPRGDESADEGSTTLHIAGDDLQLEADDTPMMHVVRRAVLGMNRGLAVARRYARATSDARDLRAISSHMIQSEKLATLGQLAAGVVHELNNPLTSIVAYTDWLIRKLGPGGDPDSLERLRRIGESSTRILRFTRDLVAYARPSSETPVPIDLHVVIEQALAFCEHVLAKYKATVERGLAASVPAIRGMPEQLVQVFVNLFTNACHAMPEEGGKLRVTSCTSDAGLITVTVEDNGQGVAPEHATSIFVPFFTTKTDGLGTGLGLSIVRNIMDNHAADIRVERSSEGGARFVLTFRAST